MLFRSDLDALADGARAVGLEVVGQTTQAEFLVGVGLGELIDQARTRAGEDWAAHRLLRSAAARLLDPRQLGGYAVVVLGRGMPSEPALLGLGYRIK